MGEETQVEREDTDAAVEGAGETAVQSGLQANNLPGPGETLTSTEGADPSLNSGTWRFIFRPSPQSLERAHFPIDRPPN